MSKAKSTRKGRVLKHKNAVVEETDNEIEDMEITTLKDVGTPPQENQAKSASALDENNRKLMIKDFDVQARVFLENMEDAFKEKKRAIEMAYVKMKLKLNPDILSLTYREFLELRQVNTSKTNPGTSSPERRSTRSSRTNMAAEKAKQERDEADIEQARLEEERAEEVRVEKAREQTRVEQAKVEQARVEQAKVKQAREEVRVEQAKVEQARVEKVGEQAKVEKAREQARVEQAKVEQARVEKVGEQAKVEKAREQARVEQAKVEQARAEQTKADEIQSRPDNQLVLRQSVLAREPRIVLAKFDPSKPVSAARWPAKEEVSVSLSGSPIVTPHSVGTSSVNLNIPLQNGKVLAILARPMAHLTHMPEVSDEVLEQLDTIEANLGIVRRLCLQQRSQAGTSAITPRARK